TWTHRSSTGEPVTDAMKKERALEIARLLCSNERWKSHGHGITRGVANQELQLVIDHPESQPGLERAIRRFWALGYYFCELPVLGTLFLSGQYSFLLLPPHLA